MITVAPEATRPSYICGYCHGPLDPDRPHRYGCHAYAFDGHASCADVIDSRRKASR